jgi:hypothetical protein
MVTIWKLALPVYLSVCVLDFLVDLLKGKVEFLISEEMDVSSVCMLD